MQFLIFFFVSILHFPIFAFGAVDSKNMEFNLVSFQLKHSSSNSGSYHVEQTFSKDSDLTTVGPAALSDPDLDPSSDLEDVHAYNTYGDVRGFFGAVVLSCAALTALLLTTLALLLLWVSLLNQVKKWRESRAALEGHGQGQGEWGEGDPATFMHFCNRTGRLRNLTLPQPILSIEIPPEIFQDIMIEGSVPESEFLSRSRSETPPPPYQPPTTEETGKY